MDEQKELEKIFEKANEDFLRKNHTLFTMQVAERTLCGALMLALHNMIASTIYKDYFVDVEYNRNCGGKLNIHNKTIKGPKDEIITINCDLIVHNRGKNTKKDNLIALEMKKSHASSMRKESDRTRLKCLTKTPDDTMHCCEGDIPPEHVCGYKLGIYYEVNFKKKVVLIEYYREGDCYKKYLVSIL